MRKITDFIINKRHFILLLFIILTIISAILSSKVKVNYDIAKYLPSTSETRIGMDIMEAEFSETQTGTLNLMFENLANEEKSQIKDYLENIEGVKSIDYDNSENYNKDNYTLYVITVDDKSDSQMATDIYDQIVEKYKDYTIYTSGDVAESNKTVLPLWIIVLAVGCALVILLIMCESYVEPFLFLTSILMAIVLNKGTNIIFANVSHITNSIVAILQMALSMDYSIMLMNRYDQEKQNETDKIKAMKNALYKAFQAISSSSVTTIVGLLALVFMSFKIGRDLGFVLAKGVLFSLICIFFVLPALILMFDKWIVKTKKRSPNIKLDKLGKFSYKIRFIAVPMFLIVFIASFMLKGNLGINYTDSQENKISDVFSENNQMAIIYKNDQEEKISKYLEQLKDSENIDEVLGYGNTINENLTYDKLNSKLNDLGSDVNVEDYLLKILYFDYYNPDGNNTMTFNDFVSFIEEEAYKNEKTNEKIDDNTKKDIARLKNFVTQEAMNQKRASSDIANILEIDESKINDIFIYYLSKNNNNVQLSLNEFINFMNKDVLTNSKYSAKIDSQAKSKLNTLSKFTNKQNIQSKMTSNQMAELFGIDKNTMSELYKYYILVNDIDTKMTLSEFSNFVLNDVLKNNNYANSFDEKTIQSIKLLSTFSNTNVINKEMTSQELASLLGIEDEKVKQILLLKYSGENTGSKLSITEFINNTLVIKNSTHYLDGVDVSKLASLSVFAQNQNNINVTKMNKTGLSNVFNSFGAGLVDKVYMIAGLPESYTMTPQEFVNLVLKVVSSSNKDVSNSGNTTSKEDANSSSSNETSKDESNTNSSSSNEVSKGESNSKTNAKNIESEAPNKSNMQIDANTVNNLKLLKMIIDDSISTNKTRYTAIELSKILNMNTKQMNQLYSLIDYSTGNTSNWTATPNEFVKLILNNSNNENIKNNVNETTMKQLNLLSTIMASTANNVKYTYKDLSQVIGVDNNSTKSIYTLYVSKNNTTKLTPQEFVNFVLTHKNDATLSKSIANQTVKDLNLVQSVMNGVINNKKYNSSNLSSLLGINKEDLDLLYGLYSSKYVNKNLNMSLKDFVGFLLNDVTINPQYSSNFDEGKISKLNTVNGIMSASINNTKYTSDEICAIISQLTDGVEKNTVKVLYAYYGSEKQYNNDWTMTVEGFVKYLNEKILQDERFTDFIDDDMRKDIIDAKTTIDDAKKLIIGKEYSRIVLNTTFDSESKETFEYIQKVKDMLSENVEDFYIIGNSPMAYEMSQTFDDELNFMTIITMIAIFIVVAVTFKSIIIPVILVLIIQCAVYLTMGILSFTGENVYFISILIVQSILMGATIDYAILYTSYYLENRRNEGIKEAIIDSYNKSIHTILTSSSILIIVTLIIANFASAIAAKICKTISEGTICSTILILLLLPAVLAFCDKIIIKRRTIVKHDEHGLSTKNEVK